METIPARWFTKVGPGRPKEVIVLHSMEAEEKPDTAEGVGHFFQNLPASNKASAHVGVDETGPVRYVEDDDVAYAAPGCNANGLHVELAGFARYLDGDWHQDRMVRMLQQAAPVVRDWSDRYGIPRTFRRAADLTARRRGITTHYEVSQAFHQSDHTDPGKGFPIDFFLSMVNNGTPSVEEAKGMMNAPCVEILSTASGEGYYLIGADGGVFAFGDAQFFGSTGGIKLNAPITGAALLPGGKGYWLVAADGGVFSFGQAQFFGSMGGKTMNGPIKGIAAHPSGAGYWLAGSDGGVFAFGASKPFGTPYDFAKK